VTVKSWSLSTRMIVGLSVLVTALILGFWLLRPARAPIPPVEEALRQVPAPILRDIFPLKNLAEAIDSQLQHIYASKQDSPLRFGPHQIPRVEYAEALKRLSGVIYSEPDANRVYQYLAREFDFLEVYGTSRWGQVFVTGYFEPVLQGSQTKTAEFSQPLYSAPQDLLKLDLARFGERWKGERALRARVEGDRVLPYYSRAEIDNGLALEGRGLELAWVRPIDAFFLQVQGSGIVELSNGQQLIVGFAEKNGHPYEAIGRLLKDRIAPLPATYPNLVNYLRGLSSQDLQAALNLNPSYVFFRLSDKNAVTATGVPAATGRTIATDHKFFPPGALGFLDLPDSPDSQLIGPRFVLNQDVGGAIKGPGRVDLFVGRGEAAGMVAGVLQAKARLYFLLPRDRS
jgi:membrane-bound lytic murein transglycosylase A